MIGYSFGDSEVLLEITPNKEVQVSIESEIPTKVAKNFNFQKNYTGTELVDRLLTPQKKQSVSSLENSQIELKRPLNFHLKKLPIINEDPHSSDLSDNSMNTERARNSPTAKKGSFKSL